ncbi:MAG TPA: hypothetical protein VGS22_24000 [Thermoanaerobaculia bacterium]|nr:hypothetical protein [Thermoanaerobaculia bacterium]
MGKTERILSYLPGTFRVAEGSTRPSALRAVAAAFGGELQGGENTLAALMRAHWVDHADRGAEEIDDLRRFAVLWGLAPRVVPEPEGVEEFREHLKRYVKNQLRGTVTVAGILRVAAETLGLRLAFDVAEEEDPATFAADPLAAGLDSWWRRSNAVLEDLGPDGQPRRRRFVTRAFVAGEAARTLFGFESRAASGTSARPARLAGTADLSSGVDLSTRKLIRLGLDGEAAHEIDCAGARPRATTLDEIAAKINTVYPDIATHDGRRLSLTSRTAGAASRISFDFVPPESDARDLLFGPGPAAVTGIPALPAVLTAEVVHGGVIDLSRRALLRLSVDGGAPVEIDVEGAAPASTLLPEVAGAIEDVLPGVASITSEDRLRLTSPTLGPDSRVEVLPLRTIEVEEFPPAAAETHATKRAGERLGLENRGASEMNFTLSIRAPRGAWAPGFANLRDGWIVRALVALAPGETIRFRRAPGDGGGAVSASIEIAEGVARSVPANLLFVGSLALGSGAAARALILPLGSTELTLLEGLAARFDAARFDEDRFAGPPLLVEGRFDLVRFAPPVPIKDPAAPLFAPVAPGSSLEVEAHWIEHRPGSFVVRLPRDLPPRFGGRFDDARFGYPDVETIDGAVLDDGDARSIPALLPPPPALSGSKLVTAARVGRAPIGFTAHRVPFRATRFLSGGGPVRASRLYLTEPGVPDVIEISANRPGAWGDEISVAVRPAGPALWDLEIRFGGARFENARQAVLGPPLAPAAREPQPPGPRGILSAKAAGVHARVVRDGAELPEPS